MSKLDGWIELLRPGTFRCSRGVEHTFSVQDLEAIAANTAAADPAPAVVGHPRVNDPAYGWIERVRVAGGRLQARFRDWAPAFRAAVEEGRYRGRSVRLVGDPGQQRIDHVGWLGAYRPAVDGLQPATFAGAEDGASFEFADSAMERSAWMSLADGLASLRDLLIDKFTVDEAARALPRWLIDSVRNAADSGDADETEAAAMAAPTEVLAPDEEDEMSDSDEALRDREQAVQQREEEVAQRDAEFARRDAVTRERVFVDAQVRAGRVLPADAEPLAEFLGSVLGDGEAVAIEFADAGGQTRQADAGDWLRGWIKRLPVQVDYAEHAPSGAYRPQRPSGARRNVDLAAEGHALAQRIITARTANPALSQEQALDQAKREMQEESPS